MAAWRTLGRHAVPREQRRRLVEAEHLLGCVSSRVAASAQARCVIRPATRTSGHVGELRRERRAAPRIVTPRRAMPGVDLEVHVDRAAARRRARTRRAKASICADVVARPARGRARRTSSCAPP